MIKYQEVKRERQAQPLGGYKESHPCFGMARLSRVQGTIDLFGSNVKGRNGFTTLSISQADRLHDYSQDRCHGRKELIEIAMSESQFAEMITTWNQGEGIPVTLLRTSDGPLKNIPRIPQQDQTETERAENLFREETSDAVKGFRSSKDALNKILNKKGAITKGDRIQIEKIFWKVDQWLTDNAPFAVQTFGEATERAVSKAKVEVEAFVSNIVRKTGLDALQKLRLQGTVDRDDEPEAELAEARANTRMHELFGSEEE